MKKRTRKDLKQRRDINTKPLLEAKKGESHDVRNRNIIMICNMGYEGGNRDE